MRILLDMDGVCFNLVKQMCLVHGHDYDHVMCNWPKGEYSLEVVLGLTAQELWEPVDEAFWEEMEMYPWTEDLIQQCIALVGKNDVYFCSSPTLAPSSLSGKLKLLQKHFGPYFRQYIFTPDKRVCKVPGTYLIDDSESNCRKFGNGSFLFPMPFNSVEGTPEQFIEKLPLIFGGI